MKRRRRTLRPDELELWARVQATAAPLHPAPPPAPQPPAPLPPLRDPAPARPGLSGLILPRPDPLPGKGGVSLDLRPSLSERLAGQRIDMDRKRFGKLKRGKLEPEGRIDLHGMTQAEAHSALTGFILMSHRMGRRLVLVITGKGAGKGWDREPGVLSGVLRNQVPHWLSLPPLRGVILQLAEAHPGHGGSGALYVYLRRNREG